MDFRSEQYEFEYDRKRKVLADEHSEYKNVNYMTMPRLSVLDPVRLGEKFNMKPSETKMFTDFRFSNDLDLLDQRLKGQLPTIEIIGHTFFVDVRMNSLRPEDDFSTSGILFNEHLPLPGDVYQMVYDPKKHMAVELDKNLLTEIPKHLSVIQFPILELLDPVGVFMKNHGYSFSELRYPGIDRGHLERFLMSYPIQPLEPAKQLSWKQAGYEQIIAENKKRVDLGAIKDLQPPKVAPKRKGRKL